jgi:hypothetical protein
MKKNNKTASQKKSANKRGQKRSQRLKATQKEKHVRKLTLANARKKAEEKFEQQMRDLFGKK